MDVMIDRLQHCIDYFTDGKVTSVPTELLHEVIDKLEELSVPSKEDYEPITHFFQD